MVSRSSSGGSSNAAFSYDEAVNDEETKQRRHQLWIDVLTEVGRVGFTEEQQVVLAPMRLRPSEIVEAEGSKYSSPGEWSAAIEHALMGRCKSLGKMPCRT